MVVLMTKDANPTLVADILNEFMKQFSIKGLKKGIEKCRSDLLYRHPDLYRFAEQAKKEGKGDFYVRPVDPQKPYGKLERCEPEYEEILVMPREEINIELIKDIDELNNIKEVTSNLYTIIDKGEAIGLLR